MLKDIINFFDRLEDKIRHWLSHRPILYAFIGGTGVVLFWRGIWHTADYLTNRYLVGIPKEGANTIDLIIPFWWDGMFSLIVGTSLLLFTGLMVSSFIGTEIIISGLLKDKKEGEKKPRELIKEANAVERIENDFKKISKKLKDIEKKIDKKS
ncbi:MAG: hypothetical protein ACWGHO_00665 [Candidatus Moraniibacteriota bacterium]